MNEHSDPNPGDPNPDGHTPSEGRHGPPPDGTEPMESGVLPDDFGRRLERLKEASGLSWRGLARALGADPKQLGRWRKGVEPCGGAMHSIHRFAYGIPGGTEILMDDDLQLGLFDEEEREDEDGVDRAEDRVVDDEENRDQDQDREEEEEC